MSVSLLDVNVLVALFDPDHIHHEAAHAWFAVNRPSGWATCPLTENGLVRILSNPAYTGVHEPPAAITRRLEQFCQSGHHSFWPDEISLRDRRLFRAGAPLTHRQVTDVYLLGLARHNGGRLATFDRKIPVGAVTGAERGHLELISA
ncbi:MAG: PIN domain-containing protein [Deltaproteobacteria bacterium]|nr:PIN domain-containing protein [Deltaproteobacteria bacterium]